MITETHIASHGCYRESCFPLEVPFYIM